MTEHPDKKFTIHARRPSGFFVLAQVRSKTRRVMGPSPAEIQIIGVRDLPEFKRGPDDLFWAVETAAVFARAGVPIFGPWAVANSWPNPRG